MDETRLNEIRERHARATKGPWGYESGTVITKIRAGDYSDAVASYVEADNAAFIAHSWQDIADLIAEVERLRASQLVIRRVERAPFVLEEDQPPRSRHPYKWPKGDPA